MLDLLPRALLIRKCQRLRDWVRIGVFSTVGFISLQCTITSAPKKEKAPVTQPRTFLECCDASAAVALDNHRFVVGDDETSVLRVYDWTRGGRPIQSFDLQQFLNPKGGEGETDIEAAAKLGDHVYWLTSHGKSQSGKARPDRNRLFATVFRTNETTVSMELVGKPYEKLLKDLIADPHLTQFGFRSATKRAPKEDQSLNFEGLCATAQGNLLLGFRNPLVDGKALLIPLLNPLEITSGNARASFGPPILLDLGGLTIRDLVSRAGSIYILAGPWKGGQERRIYRWDGKSPQVELVTPITLDRFHSEALFAFPNQSPNLFTVLSDDGSRKAGDVPCKDLPIAQREFRGFEWRTLQIGNGE